MSDFPDNPAYRSYPLYFFGSLVALISVFLSWNQAACQSLPFSLHSVSLPPLSYSSIAWGDYDHDGDLDLAMNGVLGNVPVTRIMTNTQGNFSELASIQPGLHMGSVDWCDFDADNDLDLLVTGMDNTGNGHTMIISNTAGNFGNSGIILPAVSDGMALWGEANNDGKPDILLAGSMYSKVLINDGNNTFNDLLLPLPAVQSAMVSWCDFNNDGWMDILICGDTGGGFVTTLFENQGGTFTEVTISPEPFIGLYSGQVKWADLDLDGDQDMVITGMDLYIDGWLIAYRNDGNNQFTRFSVPNGNFLSGSLDIGDYNSDGLPDIILMGRTAGCGGTASTLLFENNGNFNFQPLSTLIPGFKTGSVVWGDYNGDGFSDLLFSGLDGFDIPHTSLYLNNTGDTTFSQNLPPARPEGSSSMTSSGFTRLFWKRATDNHTPAQSLTYNLQIGTQPGFSDVMDPLADTASGNRWVAAPGNASADTSWILAGISPGTYYFSVQAIDNGFAASPFSIPTPFYVAALTVDERTNNLRVNLFPNPCSHTLSVDIPGEFLVEKSLHHGGIPIISMINMDGRMVMEIPWAPSVDVSLLPSGPYQVVLSFRDHMASGFFIKR
jgi:hypothetical protein